MSSGGGESNPIVKEITNQASQLKNNIKASIIGYQNSLRTKKNELGSLDYLYHYLITEVFSDKNYFDFGPSHEENGMKINSGILFWKESFGAKTTIQSYYEVTTANYKLLENILI